METLTLRPEVAAFAQVMERRLRANDHKPGWKDDTPIGLYARLRDESLDLIGAASGHYGDHPDLGRPAILREAANVANYAMFIADVCGMLLPDSDKDDT